MVEEVVKKNKGTYNGVEIWWREGKWIKIKDSYLIVDESDMVNTLWWFMKETGYVSRRSFKSLVTEWKAHNRLYYWGICKDRTRDCDLEEDQKWYLKIFYWLLGR